MNPFLGEISGQFETTSAFTKKMLDWQLHYKAFSATAPEMGFLYRDFIKKRKNKSVWDGRGERSRTARISQIMAIIKTGYIPTRKVWKRFGVVGEP